jgi:hypothetical protein
VHDLFDILGLPTNAPPSEVRRACARRPRRQHPDFDDGAASMPPGQPGPDLGAGDGMNDEVAIDFVDVAPIVTRIQAAFFLTT